MENEIMSLKKEVKSLWRAIYGIVICSLLVLFVAVAAPTNNDAVTKHDLQSINIRLDSLTRAGANDKENISRLYRNDSLIVNHQNKQSQAQRDAGFLSFLLKML